MTSDRSAALWASAVSALMIAQQVGGKATRDALFLASFDVRRLPVMLIGSAAVSLFVALGAVRLLRARGPIRVIPAAFLASGVLLSAEWGLARTAPAAAAVLVYLHTAVFGAFLISGFWSLVIGLALGVALFLTIEIGGVWQRLDLPTVHFTYMAMIIFTITVVLILSISLAGREAAPDDGARFHPSDLRPEAAQGWHRDYRLYAVLLGLATVATIVFAW